MQDILDRLSDFLERAPSPDTNPDEQEKGGGKRKRRTAYPSGRREKALGLRRKKILGGRSDIKQAAGLQQKKTRKRSISGSRLAGHHRWKKF